MMNDVKTSHTNDAGDWCEHFSEGLFQETNIIVGAPLEKKSFHPLHEPAYPYIVNKIIPEDIIPEIWHWSMQKVFLWRIFVIKFTHEFQAPNMGKDHWYMNNNA